MFFNVKKKGSKDKKETIANQMDLSLPKNKKNKSPKTPKTPKPLKIEKIPYIKNRENQK